MSIDFQNTAKNYESKCHFFNSEVMAVSNEWKMNHVVGLDWRKGEENNNHHEMVAAMARWANLSDTLKNALKYTGALMYEPWI